MTDIIELKNVSKNYYKKNSIKVLKKINFVFEKGKIYSITGPSGSGKSTLLNLISLIDEPTSGSIKIDETIINYGKKTINDKIRAKKIGIVYQDKNLLSDFTALENVYLARLIFKNNLNDLEGLLQLSKNNRHIEVYFKDYKEINFLKSELEKIFTDEYIYTWADLNKSLFSALKVERNVMFIIMSLIIVVAAFNIISGLTIFVKNKTREIAILKSIGVSSYNIKKIFFLIGFFIGTFATFFGVILGVLFSIYI